jgi:broad specificity phosphatase PhoE
VQHGPQLSAVSPTPIFLIHERAITSAIQSIPEFRHSNVVVALSEGQLSSVLSSPADSASILVTRLDLAALVQSRATLSEFRARSLEESLELSHKENLNNYRAALQAQERAAKLQSKLDLLLLGIELSDRFQALRADLVRAVKQSREHADEAIRLQQECDSLASGLEALRAVIADQREELADSKEQLHFVCTSVADCRRFVETLEPSDTINRILGYIDRWQNSLVPFCPPAPDLFVPHSPTFLPRTPSPLRSPLHASASPPPGIDS